MTAFLSGLLRIPTVLCAASVKAALVVGCPAPGANRLREKTVTCFLAATAMTITANLPLPGMSSCIGLSLCHFAGIFNFTFLCFIRVGLLFKGFFDE
jgi:hypothetical protein